MAENFTELEIQLKNKFNIELKFIDVEKNFTSDETEVLLINLTFMIKLIRGEKKSDKNSHKKFLNVINNNLTPTTIFEVTYKKFIKYYDNYFRNKVDKRNENFANLETSPVGLKPISSDKYEKKYAHAKWTARTDRSKIF